MPVLTIDGMTVSSWQTPKHNKHDSTDDARHHGFLAMSLMIHKMRRLKVFQRIEFINNEVQFLAWKFGK